MVADFKDLAEEVVTGRSLEFQRFSETPVVPAGYPAEYRAKSWSGPKRYDVNLESLSCTCPDFVERRSQFPTDSFRRLCKHIGVAFQDLGQHPRCQIMIDVGHFVCASPFKAIPTGSNTFRRAPASKTDSFQTRSCVLEGSQSGNVVLVILA